MNLKRKIGVLMLKKLLQKYLFKKTANKPDNNPGWDRVLDPNRKFSTPNQQWEKAMKASINKTELLERLKNG